MSKKKTVSFETQIQRLQAIVQELAQGDLPLEKNIALYKEGKELAASCKQMLDAAQHEMQLVTDTGLEPFVPQDKQ